MKMTWDYIEYNVYDLCDLMRELTSKVRCSGALQAALGIPEFYWMLFKVDSGAAGFFEDEEVDELQDYISEYPRESRILHSMFTKLYDTALDVDDSFMKYYMRVLDDKNMINFLEGFLKFDFVWDMLEDSGLFY